MAIITVHGEGDPENVEIALPHEHLFVDLRRACKRPIDPVESALVDSRVSMRNVGRLKRNPYVISVNSFPDEHGVPRVSLSSEKSYNRAIESDGVRGHHLHSAAGWALLPGGGHGLGEPAGAGLAAE